VGAGVGLIRGLRALDNVTRNNAAFSTLEARVDTLHVAVARLAGQAEQFQAGLDRAITKKELAETLDRVFGRLEVAVNKRFEQQGRSVDALREMVGQTDALLQRVLDGLESMNAGDEPLTRAAHAGS
jgi:hypothetical protein